MHRQRNPSDVFEIVALSNVSFMARAVPADTDRNEWLRKDTSDRVSKHCALSCHRQEVGQELLRHASKIWAFVTWVTL